MRAVPLDKALPYLNIIKILLEKGAVFNRLHSLAQKCFGRLVYFIAGDRCFNDFCPYKSWRGF